MPFALAISDVLHFVAACAVAHPAVLDVPDYVSMPYEVVSHAQTESHMLPLSVGLNADPARGLLHETRTFSTIGEAVAFTAEAITVGRSVDAGVMGINLRAHPSAFASLADAFDPALNICQGALVLAEAFREVREARCIYNSGRRDCRNASGTNGYPEAVAASARALREAVLTRIQTAGGDAGQVAPLPAPVPPSCAPNWDVWAVATCSDRTSAQPGAAPARGVVSVSINSRKSNNDE